jgi:hypothetical protein
VRLQQLCEITNLFLKKDEKGKDLTIYNQGLGISLLQQLYVHVESMILAINNFMAIPPHNCHVSNVHYKNHKHILYYILPGSKTAPMIYLGDINFLRVIVGDVLIFRTICSL